MSTKRIMKKPRFLARFEPIIMSLFSNSNNYVNHNFEFRLRDIFRNKICVSDEGEEQIPKRQEFWADPKDTRILGRSQRNMNFGQIPKRHEFWTDPKDTGILVRSQRLRYKNSGQILKKHEFWADPKETRILGRSQRDMNSGQIPKIQEFWADPKETGILGRSQRENIE